MEIRFHSISAVGLTNACVHICIQHQNFTGIIGKYKNANQQTLLQYSFVVLKPPVNETSDKII